MDFAEFVRTVTPLAGVLGAVVASLKFIGVRSKNEKMREVGEAFRTVVDSLSSENEVKRLSGAILIRRFFDDKTELGVSGTPYATEAVGVIASLLRDMSPGENGNETKRASTSNNLQKLLADGLAYAPSLKNADLQGANLDNAYLVSRSATPVTISGADLYKASLISASLRGIRAEGAVFYDAVIEKARFNDASLNSANFCEAQATEARFSNAALKQANFDGAVLKNARFDGANLKKASFDGANLEGAGFENATLAGARFRGVKGLTASVAEKLNDGVYPGDGE